MGHVARIAPGARWKRGSTPVRNARRRAGGGSPPVVAARRPTPAHPQIDGLHIFLNGRLLAQSFPGLFQRHTPGEVGRRGASAPHTAPAPAAQVLLALQHLHKQKIVHRDIKPENILYIENGGTDIKLIDFGYVGPERTMYTRRSRVNPHKQRRPRVLSS